MKTKLVLLLVLLIGCVAVFLFWPRTLELPKLGTIEQFQMNTIEGKEFQLSKDKPKLITFFYTHCPDVCPMTMFDLKKFQDRLQEDGVTESEYDMISITLDPEVDTVERIAEYKKGFDITSSNWFFLRGTEQQTKQITEQFNMVYQKNSDGFITHSTTMYLVDADNNIRSYHDMATSEKNVNLEELGKNLRMLLQN